MGYRYGKKSLKVREELHPLLQTLMDKILEKYDICLICGYRTEETQNRYYRQGLSKLKYPQSKHNKQPSLAVDIAVYHKVGGVSFNEKDLIYMSGYIKGVADIMGIPIRVGSIWNKQWVSENGFLDAGHIELVL